MELQIYPTHTPVGAQISGIDLSEPIDDSTIEKIKSVLDDFGMIYLRNQLITPAQLVAFGRRLGQLEKHVFDQFLLHDYPEIVVLSNIIENGIQIGVSDAGQFWHTDGAFNQSPHIYSMLHSQEIPVDAAGQSLGDTMFVSTVNAFKRLDANMQNQLKGLNGLHSLITQYKKKMTSKVGKNVPLTNEQKARTPDLYHPVIWVHPRSGKECLYINEGTTFGIQGMDEKNAIELIEQLCDHIKKPEFVYCHKWAVGDILIWDNFSTQHKVNFNFSSAHRRKMHRMSIC